MRYPDEPHQIVGGILVHVGAVSMLRDLVATGHRVVIDETGEVIVLPDDLHENAAHCLEAFQEDLTILLTLGGERVH